MTEERPVERRIGDLLGGREETVAVAESCTGGLVSSRLTDIPGSSDYFDRSVVSYSYDSKLEELCVNRETLDDRGAVSEAVAAQMARGIRDSAGTSWGVGTTGIAGPTGATEAHPVGTVFLGIAYSADWGTGDSFTTVERHVFDGSRKTVKQKITEQALCSLESAAESVD